MAEQTTSVNSPASDARNSRGPNAEARPDPQRQLAERDEEILRLRDLLIGKDAELGALRGQLAALEHHSQRLASLAARVPIPGLGRLIAAVLGRLRG